MVTYAQSSDRDNPLRKPRAWICALHYNSCFALLSLDWPRNPRIVYLLRAARKASVDPRIVRDQSMDRPRSMSQTSSYLTEGESRVLWTIDGLPVQSADPGIT